MATENDAAGVAVEVAEPRTLESLSETQYLEWRKTGNLPTEAAEKKESAGESTEKKADAAPKETATEKKGTVEKQEQSVHRYSYRELRQRVRELEGQLSERTVSRTKPPVEADEPITTTLPKKDAAADRPRPKADDVDDKGKAKYATIEDFFEDLADWKADQKIKIYTDEQQKQAKENAEKAAQRQVSERWSAQVESARKNHADFDKVALDKDMVVPAGSAVEQWVLDSDIGTEILYYLGQHRDELAAIHRMSPIAAARHLTALEAELSGEDEPEDNEEDLPAAKTETKTSKAPPPSREVGGRGTAVVDEVTKAVADDDTGAYIRAMNRRQLAKKKT